MGVNEENRRPDASRATDSERTGPDVRPAERLVGETYEADEGGRPGADYDSRVAPFVEHLAADFAEAGMQRMAARVFACVLASEEGVLSSAELSVRLRCSPAAVSGAVRYLNQMHMIRREREPGSRRERYRVPDDTWMEVFANRDDYLVKWASTMWAGARQLGTDTDAGRRIQESAEFFDFLKVEFESMLKRWREHRARPHGA